MYNIYPEARRTYAHPFSLDIESLALQQTTCGGARHEFRYLVNTLLHNDASAANVSQALLRLRIVLVRRH